VCAWKNFVNNFAAYLKQPPAPGFSHFPFGSSLFFLLLLFTIKIPTRQFTKIVVLFK